jgi:thiol:disulfide interchange protein DsbD
MTIMKRLVVPAVLVAAFCAALAPARADATVPVTLTLEPTRQAAGQVTTARFEFVCLPAEYVQADGLSLRLAGVEPEEPGIFADAPVLPEVKTKFDALLEMPVRYFDGRFTVGLPIAVSDAVQPGEYTLAFAVRYQSCSPTLCEFARADPTAVLTVVPPEAAPPVAPLVPARVPPGQPDAVVPAEPPSTGPPPAVEQPAAGGESLEESVVGFLALGPLLAILTAYLAGLALTFTPCVYPLIPVTVSLVGATSARGRLDGFVRSLAYVLGIATTYSAAGVIAASSGGLFGAVLQHPLVYLALAAIFVAMAGSMFDWYTFTLASARVQRLQATLRGKAGLLGIFAVGILSGSAATACAAPIIASVFLYVGQRGDLLLGFLMFFVLGLGVGTPLLVAGTFTGVLKAMPRAGGWMVTVKHAMGLALLGAAVYFVGRSLVLPPTAYRLLTAAFLLGASVFVGAFDVLSPRSGTWSRLRKAAGLIFLAGGVWAFAGAIGLDAAVGPSPTGGEQIAWLTSEPEALGAAQEQGKPLLLDFWADSCPACVHMLRTTFRDPRVVAESRRFVCAKLDFSDADDPEAQRLREKYGFQSIPMVILVDPAGNQRSYAEELGADELLARMEAVR